MAGPEPNETIRATDLGPGRGVEVKIARQHLERLDLDPDAPMDVKRGVMGEDSMRLRFKQPPEDLEG